MSSKYYIILLTNLGEDILKQITKSIKSLLPDIKIQDKFSSRYTSKAIIKENREGDKVSKGKEVRIWPF